MGTWSTAIDGNDTFLDVYSTFFNLYNQGCSPSYATKQLMNEFQDVFSDSDDQYNALFALALAQWETKSLDNSFLHQIVNIVETGKDLEVWQSLSADEKQIEERKSALTNFIAKLSVPKDKPKRRVKQKVEVKTTELVNITSPDRKKTFTITEVYTNGKYVHTGSLMQWFDGGTSVLYYEKQNEHITAEWINSQILKIIHSKDIVFTKKDDNAYYSGDEVKIIYSTF